MNRGCLHRLGAWSCEPRLFASSFAIQGCWRRLGAGYARRCCFLHLGGLGDANRACWHMSSMPTLCSPCCRWTCHVIHVNVVLAVLSLDLPQHPHQRCARRVVVGLATTSVLTLRSPCCHWACHFILGISASTLGLLVVVGLCPSRGEGKGVSRSGERKCKHDIPHGLPQHGSPLAFP